MSSNTLGTSLASGITLTASGQYLSPFTVTAAGTITASTIAANAQDGVFSAIAAPDLTNAGLIVSSQAIGVYFAQGGTVSNITSTARITGSDYGVKIASAAGSVFNDGTIAGTGNQNVGVYLYAGELTNNGPASSVAGYRYGVDVKYDSGTILNAGHISASGSYSTGVYFFFGNNGTADVANTAAGAVISGGGNGVNIANAAGTVSNAGTITGGKLDGVYLRHGGVVTNTGTAALVSGGGNGVLFSEGYGTVVNNGSIYGGGSYAGIYAESGATISNLGTAAQISGKYSGISVNFASGTVLNDGTIDGTFSSGVFLAAGGLVTNELLTSRIFGNQYGVRAATYAATVVNAGSILSNTNGVSLGAGGIVMNTGTSALIDGRFGIIAETALATVMNAGTVSGSSFGGIELAKGGLIENIGTASLIYSAQDAVFNNGATTLINAGTIRAVQYYAVDITGGGAVTNSGTAALISSGRVGVEIRGAAGIVINDGTIQGASYSNAVYLYAGTVTNSGPGAALSGGYNGVVIRNAGARVTNDGTISGSRFDGIDLKSGGTVTNAGTISGAQYAVSLGGAGASRLIVDPGAAFTGSIAAAGTGNVLELGSSATSGTLAGLGGSVTGFETIAFDAGAHWLVAGTAAGLQNDLITGFAPGDTLVLDGLTTNSESFSAGTLTLFTGAGTVDLDFTGNLSLASFHISNIAAGTQIELCYLRGTEILTPEGPRAVETLRIGDAVVTRFSGVQPIKWIGLQSYAARFLAPSPAKYPVCISAGALGEGLPRQDLYVSAGHSMLLGGTLVLAQNLVNGITITQTHLPELVAYFAIELQHHDCVLAHGAWGETFADGPGLRNQFHNIADYRVRHPDYEEPCEVSLCAPRPQAGLVLDAALRDVAARAAACVSPGALRGYIEILHSTGRIEGWAQDTANPELPVLLEIFAGPTRIGTALACSYRGDLAEAGIGRGHGQFTFQAPPASLPLDLATIQVRRAADGAEIFTTETCTRAA